MKKQIQKAKNFIKENKTLIIAGAAATTAAGLTVVALKSTLVQSFVDADDVTDEEWQEFVDAAKLLDERIAARKAEKKN